MEVNTFKAFEEAERLLPTQDLLIQYWTARGIVSYLQEWLAYHETMGNSDMEDATKLKDRWFDIWQNLTQVVALEESS